MVTFGPNDTTAEITFSVVDDDIALEETEVLEWSLELVTRRERASISPHNHTMIFIVDDDGKRKRKGGKKVFYCIHTILLFQSWFLL